MKGLARNLAAHAYGLVPIPWRLGATFRRYRALLRKSRTWSGERLQEYQSRMLRRLVEHAYASVPYYRDLFAKRRLRPADVRSVADLQRLPVLTKEEARENAARLVSERVPRRHLVAVKTSGSTGSPFHLYWDRKTAIPVEAAFVWTVANMAGFHYGDKRADLLWEGPAGTEAVYRPRDRILSLPARNLTSDVLRSHVEVLRRHGPKVLRSIPSQLVVLAAFMLENGIPPPPSIRTVVYSSEQMLPHQRDLVERAFGCRVFSFYGQTEHSILATECEVGSLHHVFPEYGVTELLDENERPITKPGTTGQLVGTGFHNPAMPLLRYATGDSSAWSDDACPCGRHYSLLTGIEGRIDEYLVSPLGDPIPLITIPYSEIMTEVRQFQFHQQQKDTVTLRIVPLPGYRDRHGERMQHRLEQALPGMAVDVECVEAIPRSAGGKVPYLIQEVPGARIDSGTRNLPDSTGAHESG